MDLSSFLSSHTILESVILNETLCLHEASYRGVEKVFAFRRDQKILSFPMPLCTTVNKDDKDFIVILCPICHNVYEESSKRLQKILDEKREMQ